MADQVLLVRTQSIIEYIDVEYNTVLYNSIQFDMKLSV